MGPALSVDAALQLVEQTEPDATELDMNLNGELVTPVTELLLERAIPSMLASGSDNRRSNAILTTAENFGKCIDQY